MKIKISPDRLIAVAEALWQQDSIRAAGRRRREQWYDLSLDEQAKWLDMANAAIMAFELMDGDAENAGP